MGSSQAVVIKSLNPLLRGWGNCYHNVCVC
ncbi:group II intron maturase-specific domain-containing protein [Wolbachia endosymbiont of Atemnus politus]